jgi:hypothetical protein
LIKAAEKVKELGVKPNKMIASNLLDTDE